MAGIFVLEQAAALRRAGIDTGLIFARVEGWSNLSPQRLPRGFPAFVRTDDPVPTWGFKTWGLPGAGALVPRLVERMLLASYRRYAAARGQPDVLHGHVALDAGPGTRRIAQAIGVPYVLTEHSSAILTAKLTAEQQERARRVYADAHCVIAVSSALAARITELCPEAKIRVIGNMVPDSVFALRGSVAASSNRLKVVTLCNLLPSKRVGDALEAVAGLPDSLRRQVDLDVIGDGPERRRLEELARSRGLQTQFHGELPRAEAMRMLAAADLLVHPSAYETFGIVLAEAAALGVPVVATRCGGPQDIVGPASGLLVDVGDVAGMRDAIASVLGDIGVWKAKAETMARCAFDRFHESRFAAAVAETYR
jgi:glycosyltransferase involved in cell wall biosynthesis